MGSNRTDPLGYPRTDQNIHGGTGGGAKSQESSHQGTKDALGRLLALRTHSHCVRAIPTLPLTPVTMSLGTSEPLTLAGPIRRAYFLFCTYSFSWGLTTTACGLLSGSQRGKEGLQEPVSSLGN